MRIVVAGAPPPSRTIERIETELGWEFIQIYGLTETSPLLTINRAPAEWAGLDRGARAARHAPGFPPWACAWDVNAEGEILARSNHVFEGYWEQPAETAGPSWTAGSTPVTAATRKAPTSSIADRKKDVIITGGENVSFDRGRGLSLPARRYPEVAVIGVPDEKWGETIKALVVLRPGQSATERELIEHCRSRLAHFKCPTSVEVRDGLGADGDRQAAEVQAARALLDGTRRAR